MGNAQLSYFWGHIRARVQAIAHASHTHELSHGIILKQVVWSFCRTEGVCIRSPPVFLQENGPQLAGHLTGCSFRYSCMRHGIERLQDGGNARASFEGMR
jgi:hypothetical protein